MTLCVECGPDVPVDEDGCCMSCGAVATGTWLEQRDVVVGHSLQPDDDEYWLYKGDQQSSFDVPTILLLEKP